MKKILLFVAALAVGAACENKPAGAAGSGVGSPDTASVAQENRQDRTDEPRETNYFPAIDRYLVNVFGKRYAGGEHCVPIHSVVSVDERNSEDILVWGDFWVFNYDLVGDTLKCVSGGSHAGLMHIRQTEKGFEVTGFDAVEDGSNYLPSAKRIFGKKYEAFHAINSDAEARERLRAEGLAVYAKKHGLGAALYQDYGWPAKKLPPVE